MSLQDFPSSPEGADASEGYVSQPVIPSADFTSEAPFGLIAPPLAASAAEPSVSTPTTTSEGIGAGNKPKLAHRTLNGSTFAEWVAGKAENVSCSDTSIASNHVSPATPADEAATTTTGEDAMPTNEEAVMAARSGAIISRAPTPRSEGTMVRVGDDEAADNEAADNEASDAEAGDARAEDTEDSCDGDEAGEDEVKKHKTAKAFPVAIHKCGDHNHAHSHSHAKQRIVRVPDGRQLFSVALKVHFNDTLISYSRALAGMSSMTDNVDNSAGLDDHDFKHLYRLIEIRVIDLVAGIDPAEKRRSMENQRLLHRYTVELDLSTGEGSKRQMGRKTFQNYGTGLIAAEEAKDIIAKLEEVILGAIKVVDGLAAQREIARRDLQHCPCSVILDSEVRRAFEEEQQYKWRIAMLESNIHSLIAEMGAAKRAIAARAPLPGLSVASSAAAG